MSKVISAQKRSELMSRIRCKNTQPELTLRSAVWSLGLRYRLHKRIDRTKPDLAFPGVKVAVFVDGCFWHQCPLHGVMPKSNQEFWQKKLARNVQRDIEATQTLVAAGWIVMRFWEHEIETSATECALKVAEVVSQRRTIRKELK